MPKRRHLVDISVELNPDVIERLGEQAKVHHGTFDEEIRHILEAEVALLHVPPMRSVRKPSASSPTFAPDLPERSQTIALT